MRGLRDLDWILPIIEGVASGDASGRAYSPYRAEHRDLASLRIAVASDLSASLSLHADVDAMYAGVCKRLNEMSTSISVASVAGTDFGALRRAGLVVVEGDLSVALADGYAHDDGLLSPGLRKMLDWIAGRRAPELAAADWALDSAVSLLQQWLGEADVLLLPTAPVPAFSHDTPTPPGHADLTAVVNMAGFPAISIPAGLSAEGMPLALQIIARPGAEAVAVAAAETISSLFSPLPGPAVFAKGV